MLFFWLFVLKIILHIVIVACCLSACTGSRKFFKAAERLEKQGLVNEAAGYYMEALQRKSGNVEARLKLKEVGQKYVSSLASEFFRNYNTQQVESSLEVFEKLRDFHTEAGRLGVQLDYPKTYEEDYQKSVEAYCLKNYNQAQLLVNQKKYPEARSYITRVQRYNTSYKNIKEIEVISYCEPLYQSAINNLESRNYSGAMGQLSSIMNRTENYKDVRDLMELATSQQTKTFILFEPKVASGDKGRAEIQNYLFENFSQAAIQKLNTVRLINNTPFQNAPGSTDLNNSTNVDLIQAIRKATAADYFYVFDVMNRTESKPVAQKTTAKGYEQVQTRINDSTVVTEYRSFNYTVVKAQRGFSFDYKYKLIDAYTNQIVSSQTRNINSRDAIEYQEFAKQFNGNINTLFPYNPKQTAPLLQYNPRNWRNLFSARNTLKTFEELKGEAYDQAVGFFLNTAGSMK